MQLSAPPPEDFSQEGSAERHDSTETQSSPQRSRAGGDGWHSRLRTLSSALRRTWLVKETVLLLRLGLPLVSILQSRWINQNHFVYTCMQFFLYTFGQAPIFITLLFVGRFSDSEYDSKENLSAVGQCSNCLPIFPFITSSTCRCSMLILNPGPPTALGNSVSLY